VEELGADHVGDVVVDRRPHEDDVLLEELGVQVVDLVAPVRRLGDVRDDAVLDGVHSASSGVFSAPSSGSAGSVIWSVPASATTSSSVSDPSSSSSSANSKALRSSA